MPLLLLSLFLSKKYTTKIKGGQANKHRCPKSVHPMSKKCLSVCLTGCSQKQAEIYGNVRKCYRRKDELVRGFIKISKPPP